MKFDLLGLGMLTALHLMVDLVETVTGERIELHEIGESDPEVYAMLSRADSVGVFQVESAPRWPPCRGCAHASSTTWSSRSR